VQRAWGYVVDGYLPFLEGVDGWWGGLVSFVCVVLLGTGFFEGDDIYENRDSRFRT
jgi:hypothetical protein